MDLQSNWPSIRRLVNHTSGVVIASINRDGSPTVAPIGSLRLRDDCTGYFIERFPRRLPNNLERDNRICVYAGGLGTWSFLMAMIRGRFDREPAIRLTGRAGPRRRLTDKERRQFQHQFRWFRWTRGYHRLWGDLKYARDVEFSEVAPVRAGKMTSRLETA